MGNVCLYEQTSERLPRATAYLPGMLLCVSPHNHRAPTYRNADAYRVPRHPGACYAKSSGRRAQVRMFSNRS
jgi:hypothetical protein